MTRFFIGLALLPLLPGFFSAQSLPSPGKEQLELSGYISSWTQDCSGAGCALPAPASVNRPVNLRLGLPSAPGEAAVAASSGTFAAGAAGELTAEVKVYALCPYAGGGSGARAGGCGSGCASPRSRCRTGPSACRSTAGACRSARAAQAGTRSRREARGRCGQARR